MIRLGAALFLAFYAWSACGPALSRIAAVAFEEKIAGPSCSLEDGEAPCMCPIGASGKSDCCCKHGHGNENATASTSESEDACAKLQACESHSKPALSAFSNLNPHVASAAWALPARCIAQAPRLPEADALTAIPDPPEKIPI